MKGFGFEYRVTLRNLDTFEQRYLEKYFPQVTYDPIRQMLIIVNAQQAESRVKEIPPSTYPKSLSNDDIAHFHEENMSSLFYPCVTEYMPLYCNERNTLFALKTDGGIRSTILDDGRWYQIFWFHEPVYPFAARNENQLVQWCIVGGFIVSVFFRENVMSWCRKRIHV